MDATQTVTLIVAIIAAISSIISAIVAAQSGSSVKRLESELLRRAKLDDKFGEFVTLSQNMLSKSLERRHRFFEDLASYREGHIHDLEISRTAVQSEEMTTLVLPNGDLLEDHLSNLSIGNLISEMDTERKEMQGFYYSKVIPSSIYILNEIKVFWFYTRIGSNYAPIVRSAFRNGSAPKFLLFDLFEDVIVSHAKLLEKEGGIISTIPEMGEMPQIPHSLLVEHQILLNRYTNSIIRFSVYISSKVHPRI